MPEIDGQPRRFFCNKCGNRRWHRSLWSDHRHFDGAKYEEWTIDYADRWLSVWECQGCEEVSFLEAWATSEDPEPEDRFLPERSVHHVKPKAYRKMSMFLGYAYEESIRAFNANCPLLCAGGLRALLEGICKDKLAPGRNLEKKIDGLAKWVPANVLATLHGFRFLGNRALHGLEVPDYKDLALAIEVIEDVMNLIYELDYKSSRLFQRVKARQSPVVAEEVEA